ncbi:MAG: histidine phosphatase family protein [Planctomycetes bacterium]|nr:histidine phosphatase family protein [Planctomycetota bacterium]
MSATPQNLTAQTDLAEFIRASGPHCLIVARHGETGWNAEGRLQGQQDIPLNERGRSQALAAARFLSSVSLAEVQASTLRRCRQTARPIAEANIGRPQVSYSDLLKETALGVLEGELKDRQSTAELTRHYQEFSRDEIRYRVPHGETLHDVAERVQQFFAGQDELLKGPGVHLIVGHRNVNKMILKHLLGLSFEEGFRVEHEHQRLYLYFNASGELWSCSVGEDRITPGYVTTTDGSYA